MVDGDVDHFVMAWDPPRNDGGSEVTGYQLQVELEMEIIIPMKITAFVLLRLKS